jgi:IclR family transcriptional regulator, KDG regulon repressor
VTENPAVSTTALKALRVVEAVAAKPGLSTLGEIAQRADLDKSATHRMLATLVVAGYVFQDEASRRYGLSYHVVSLSRNLLANNEVSRLIRVALEKLADQTGESIDVSILDGHETVVIQRVEGRQLVGVDFSVGDRSPLYCTSIGKAVLAWQPSEFIDEVLRGPLSRHASGTIVDPEKLRAELAEIGLRGYAIDDHELSDHMRCIAAPIFERDARVRMGISISGPDNRFTMDYLHELRPVLVAATTSLSAQLGGTPAGPNPD